MWFYTTKFWIMPTNRLQNRQTQKQLKHFFWSQKIEFFDFRRKSLEHWRYRVSTTEMCHWFLSVAVLLQWAAPDSRRSTFSSHRNHVLPHLQLSPGCPYRRFLDPLSSLIWCTRPDKWIRPALTVATSDGCPHSSFDSSLAPMHHIPPYLIGPYNFKSTFRSQLLRLPSCTSIITHASEP